MSRDWSRYSHKDKLFAWNKGKSRFDCFSFFFQIKNQFKYLYFV